MIYDDLTTILGFAGLALGIAGLYLAIAGNRALSEIKHHVFQLRELLMRR